MKHFEYVVWLTRSVQTEYVSVYWMKCFFFVVRLRFKNWFINSISFLFLIFKFIFSCHLWYLISLLMGERCSLQSIKRIYNLPLMIEIFFFRFSSLAPTESMKSLFFFNFINQLISLCKYDSKRFIAICGGGGSGITFRIIYLKLLNYHLS